MKKVLMPLLIVVVTSASLCAQKSATFIESGKAIRGYDPVAYFTAGKPVKGSESFKFTWNDADWYFASQKDLDLFKANPEKYAPQFGGYCAYGLSEGHKAPTDNNAWTIVNDKLYLNYSLDVKKMWSKDQNARIEKANKNWPGVKDKE